MTETRYTPTLKHEGIKQPSDQSGRNAAPSLKYAPVAQGIERCPAEAEAARSNRAGRMAYPSRFREPEMPKSAPFVPRTLPPFPPEKTTSGAQRQREAKAYWDSLSEAQEVWALRKMGYFKIGQPR
jgi:hypothetical protein